MRVRENVYRDGQRERERERERERGLDRLTNSASIHKLEASPACSK